MSKNIKDMYTILSETSGGKLTPQDVYNLETYGALSPKEFAPDPSEEPKEGYCICGTKDCQLQNMHVIQVGINYE